MTLDLGQVDHLYKINTLNLSLEIAKRLEALGMTKGAKITVLNSKNHGTLIIKVRGTRFAIGRGMSGKIDVTEVGA